MSSTPEDESNAVLDEYQKIAGKITKVIEEKIQKGEKSWVSAVGAEPNLADMKKDIQRLFQFLREHSLMVEMIGQLEYLRFFAFLDEKLDVAMMRELFFVYGKGNMLLFPLVTGKGIIVPLARVLKDIKIQEAGKGATEWEGLTGKSKIRSGKEGKIYIETSGERIILDENGIEEKLRFDIPEEIWESFKKMVDDNTEIKVDMAEIVGIGGQGIILKEKLVFRGKEIECAVKYTIYKDEIRREVESRKGKVFGKDIPEHFVKCAEFMAAEQVPTHANILQILDVSISQCCDIFYVVIGRLIHLK